MLVEFVGEVGEVGVEAFYEMAVGVHGDDDGTVSESGWMALGWAPWAMRRAAWVWPELARSAAGHKPTSAIMVVTPWMAAAG